MNPTFSSNCRIPKSKFFRKLHYRTCSSTSYWWQWKDRPPSEIQVWASLNSLWRFPREACCLRASAGNIFPLLHLLCMFFDIVGTEILRDWGGIKYPFALPVSSWRLWDGKFSLPSCWRTVWRDSRREILPRCCMFVRTGRKEVEKKFLCWSHLLP